MLTRKLFTLFSQALPFILKDQEGFTILSDTMSWRRVEQGIETLTLEVQPASCPVCHKGLYRNITFMTGGWSRCAVCGEVVHYACLAGGKIIKERPRICLDCKAGRIRGGQKMPEPAPKDHEDG